MIGSESQMKVEIWADIICPWCGLGSNRLEEAVARLDPSDDVEVVHRSFQLDPSFPPDRTTSVAEMLQSTKALTPLQVGQMTSRVERLANDDGLIPYRVLDNRVGNTALAHELLAYATEQGRHAEAWKTMFRAYFGEARSIFDQASLLELATQEMGLDGDGVSEALTSRRFRDRVRADQIEAQQLGARGVPFVVVDRRYGVAGAQPVSQLLSVLERARQEVA
jgi:predicted DsbA family dithiol-disulfide isomerase